LNLDLTAFGENTRLKVSIITMNGALVSNESMMSTLQMIDISTLPTGAYFIRVDDGQKILTNSFIKR
ncbi:MAG: T9SS type A sorting domain-containing protein, partial [Flavobacteriales bacterium]